MAAVQTAQAPAREEPAYPVRPAQRLPYPVRNLLTRWRGALGMMLGVGISLGIAMTLLAVSQATIDYYTIDFKRAGTNLYVITKGGTLVPTLFGDTPGTIKNGRSTLAQIRHWPGVTAALGFMTWSLQRDQEGPRRPDQPPELFLTVGVDGDPTQIPDVAVINQGRWVRGPNEVVLGPKLAQEKKLAIGDTLRLSGRTLTVVGLAKLRALGASVSADSVAYMDYDGFQDLAGVSDVVSIIAVQASDPAAVRQRINENGTLDAYSPQELVRQAVQVRQSAIGIYYVLIGLTMAIAALFVSNMLAHSVAERRLEFATLRAIGIPRRTILFAVGAEAILISLAAGLVGIALSLFLGFLLNAFLAPKYGLESLYSADAGLFILVYALSLALGLVSGLLPARQATRVDPVEVLREA
jgi:ABC-type antimicrobial peptide transport system permease subunit